MGFHVEYDSFSFDSIIPDLLFKLDDNILYVKYESFSAEFDIHRSSDDSFCADYESFSFYPIQINFLFEYCGSEFVESDTIATKNFSLDQTHTHIGLNRLVKCAPHMLPILFIHDNIVSRPMTSKLTHFEYVHFLFDWAQLFDKLNRALTCALLMYSFWFQLTAFYCCYIIGSWASVCDKLLGALMSFGLSCSFQVNMEWLMLHNPHIA